MSYSVTLEFLLKTNFKFQKVRFENLKLKFPIRSDSSSSNHHPSTLHAIWLSYAAFNREFIDFKKRASCGRHKVAGLTASLFKYKQMVANTWTISDFFSAAYRSRNGQEKSFLEHFLSVFFICSLTVLWSCVPTLKE